MPASLEGFLSLFLCVLKRYEFYSESAPSAIRDKKIMASTLQCLQSLLVQY